MKPGGPRGSRRAARVALNERFGPPRCARPDRDVPALVCGYPLPCPHHTAIIEPARGTVTIPGRSTSPPLLPGRLRDLARALRRR